MYSYKSIKDVSYSEIAKCLNLAFADYALPIQLNNEQLQMYFVASGIDMDLSYGAFVENHMVGFIFNSSNIYNGQKAVFDVGTGVIPEHREKKVFTNIFHFAQQELKKHQIEKYYLEVLQQNEKAISSYSKQGFTVSREFSVLKASDYCKKEVNTEVKYLDFNEFNRNTNRFFRHCNCVKPSYEHTVNVLNMNPNLYHVAFTMQNEMVSAFSVFAKADGHIVQLGYTNFDSLKIVVEHIMSKYEDITIKNIDVIYSDVLETLYTIGFHEVCKQFEMVKAITQ